MSPMSSPGPVSLKCSARFKSNSLTRSLRFFSMTLGFFFFNPKFQDKTVNSVKTRSKTPSDFSVNKHVISQPEILPFLEKSCFA